ncbi:MAG: S8 family serine peptidase [Lysobacterales bacterium]
MASTFTKSVLGVAMMAALAAAAQAQTLGGGDRDPALGVANARVNVGALKDPFLYDQLIVSYKAGDSRAAGEAVAISRHLDAVARATGQTLAYERTLSTGGHLVKVGKRLDDASMLALMNQIAADPNVEYVEPDQIMVPYLSPNDSSYSQQWHYFEATGGANLPTAWDSATGSGVVVAVLDTGITSHTDLAANVIAGYDFVSSATNARDGNGRDSNPADQGDWVTAGQCYSGSPASNSSWHGTHVAGTVAAVTNNAAGVAGVAFNAKVQPVRVLAACGGTLSDIADAITWASGGTVSGIPANATPAKVINMSLGGSSTTCASTYQTAINGAVGRGTIVVVAAGNSNVDASGATPANCSNVLTVAATNRSGGRAYYSNYGTLVDVAAPGGDVRSASTNGILSTLNAGTTTPGAQSYAWYQGTSMATPHVAGLAALILSKGSRTPADVESLIKSNARAFPAACSGCGTGIINAAATIAALSGGGGGGGATIERLANGNFDTITASGNSAADGSWSRSAFSGTSFNTLLAGQTNAQSGGSYAYLGVNATTSSQTVDSKATLIPSTATAATLSFYTSIVTSETGTTAYDKLQVQLVDASTNAVITTLVTLSNANSTGSATSYVQRSYNVAAYAGRNVKVRLLATTDSSLATTFRVDTVSLKTN